MISRFFQWPIRIIPETILWCFTIFLAFFTCSQYQKKIAAYQSLPPEKKRPNFMMSDLTLCMLPYYWMIFSGIMLTLYCINGRSAMMSLDLQYINAHWLIIKNIKNYICPRKSKLPSERYKKHPYINVYNIPKRGKSGRRLMCLNSSGLRSTDNIKFDSNSVDVFLDTCVTAGATPFKNDFLPNTFVPSIENMEG